MKKTSRIAVAEKVPRRALSIVDRMPASDLAVVKIVSSEDFGRAVEALSLLNSRLDDVIEEKEKVTRPLNEALRAERARFKPYEEKLSDAIEGIRKAMSAYQTRLLASEKATKDKVAEEVASGKMSIDKAVGVLGSGQAIVGRVMTASGAVKFRVDKVARISSIEILPKSYMVPDMVEIKRALLAGVKVPGAVLDEVQVVVNSR